MNRLLMIIIIMIVEGCQPKITTETVTSFNKEALDSIWYNGENLSSYLTSLPSIIYISTNECSECIAKFIDFHNDMNFHNIDAKIIYIITGMNKFQFDYYLREYNFNLEKNEVLINDSMDIFHSIITDAESNEIYIIKECEIIKPLFNPNKNDHSIDYFRELVKK